MNKISILFLIFVVSFSLNGCVIDGFKQRFFTKKTNKQKVVERKSKTIIETNKTKPKLYQPSASPLKKEKIEQKITKKVKNNKKIYKKKIHKIEPEPYSIKNKKSDPELLGPQTTLESNPLAKEKNIKSKVDHSKS